MVFIRRMWYSETRVQDESPAPLTFELSPYEVLVIDETAGRLFWRFFIQKSLTMVSSITNFSFLKKAK